MVYDPSEPYREARRATEAQVLARSAEAKGRAAVANSRRDVVTCAGCKAAGQGGDWGQSNCQELRRVGLCQRQVYTCITMARLMVELIRVLGEMGAGEDLVREVIAEFRAGLLVEHGGALTPGTPENWGAQLASLWSVGE